MSKTSETLSRRALVTAAAIVPLAAIAPPALASSDPGECQLVAIEAELAALIKNGEIASSAYEEAEIAMFEWNRRNPKPQMREVNFPDDAEAMAAVNAALGGTRLPNDFINTLRSLDPSYTTSEDYDPNADLKAAIAEHEAQIIQRGARKQIALKKCCYEERKAAWDRVCDASAELSNEAATIRTTTLRGMQCKARIREQAGVGDDITESIIADLLALGDAA